MARKPARKAAAPQPPASSLSHSATDPQRLDPQPLNYHVHIGFWRGRGKSFVAAFEGLAYIIRTQPNVWIELAALSVVSVVGLLFRISALEWGLLALTVALILALEAVNTAVETVVDLVSPTYHPLAKIAKDTAAGALIIAVLGSIAVAASIFGARFWAWWFGQQ